MNKKILHIMILDKFLAPFIDFVDEHFGREDHHYVFITSEKYNYGLTPEHQVEFLHTDDDIFTTLLSYMHSAHKIILHGLWRDKIDILLLQNPELFKKCYWKMWGGDFYFPEKQTRNRHEVIKNIGNCIPVTPDDYSYIKDHYNSQAKYHKCIYFSRGNKFKEVKLTESNNHVINLLIGNSATETNRHLEVFDLIKNYKNIKVTVPLSYGSIKYANEIIKTGRKIFSNFTPITKYLEFNDYLKVLEKVDIGVFNHNRQQGVSNIIFLIYLGKTLYISKENSAYKMLKDLGVIIFDTQELSPKIKELSLEIKKKNQEIIINAYSEEQTVNEWSKIFEE